jgi:hypothetical protein
MPVEMKKIILLFIISLASSGNMSAVNRDSVILDLRKKAYERYHEVKDTVTVRTWMNMDRMNKALMNVVEYDNQLIEGYLKKDSVVDEIGPRKMGSLSKEPIIPDKTKVSGFLFPLEYIYAILALFVISLLVLAVLLVKRTITIRKLKAEYDGHEEKFDSKFSRLEYLENEVIKMKARENEVKIELEKGIVDYQEKMQTLRKRIQELAEENTRLETMNISLSKGTLLENDKLDGNPIGWKKEISEENEGTIKRIKKARK